MSRKQSSKLVSWIVQANRVLTEDLRGLVLQVQDRRGVWPQTRETPAPLAAPRGHSGFVLALHLGPRAESGARASLPGSWGGSRRTHRVCRLLIRPSMSRCPAEYCSMTSFTSYGRSVSLNFLLATRNLRILWRAGEAGRGRVSQREFFSRPSLSLCCLLVQYQGSSCVDPGKQPLLRLPASLPTHHAPGPRVWYSLMCLYVQSHLPGRAGTGPGCSLLGVTLLLMTARTKTFKIDR